jgi:hypothetical protein
MRKTLFAAALSALAMIAVTGLAERLEAQPPASPVTRADSLDSLARDVARVESVRAVKALQKAYAQYAQQGAWRDAGALFSANGKVIWGDKQVAGQAPIAAWLAARSGGALAKGLAAGALHTEMIEEPLVNLSVDGQSAKARWMSLSFLGDGKGGARIEGGIYENEYVREGGSWKIAVAHYHPQYEGGYAEGWTNVGGADLPIVPFHFTSAEAGVPVPPAQGPAPASGATLAQLEQRIAALNDEDSVRNVQSAFGYYADRKMWDDVVDLFAKESAAEIGAAAIERGPEGVRKALIARMGPAGLQHGELNERPQFDVIVRVMPGGREAEARGIELGMLGDADKGKAAWEISVFRNRFVKEGKTWKLKELRIAPLMKADYHVGWGKGGLAAQRLAPLPFIGVAMKPLAGAVAAAPPEPGATLADARRRLQRSLAYDGVENISAAYGYYLDDFQWKQMGEIFAAGGNKQSPFVGYYLGRKRIVGALDASYGPTPQTRRGISFHWRTQNVIHVSHDGRSANLRTRLFQPRTYKDRSDNGGLLKNSFYGGMYPNDQVVLEPDGAWRLWSVTIDESYFESPDWKGGWSAAKEPPKGVKFPPRELQAKYPPDIPMTDLGRREEGFRGGTGDTITWPGILPMWFHYRNPVSGRTPEKYWPNCVPCEKLPEASMTRFGYQMPPTGPEIDGVDMPAVQAQ